MEARLPASRLATVQVLEYFRAFLVARAGWSRGTRRHHLRRLRTVPPVAARDRWGVWTETVGEDFELTLRLHRHLRDRGEPYRIAFVSDPVCWTEVPEQFSTLGRQRRRWQRGLWEGLRRHQRMLLNPRYGRIGLIAMPYFAVFEFLSPVFSLAGLTLTIVLWILGVISATYFAAFLLVSIGLGLLLTTAALVLEEYSYQRYRQGKEIARLLVYAVLESVGYHQLHDIWRSLVRRHRPRHEGLGHSSVRGSARRRFRRRSPRTRADQSAR